MNVIKCEESKIILILSPEDIDRYGIISLDTDIAKYIRAILKESEEAKDILSGKRLLVKIFESKEGGCELFITRLGERVSACEGIISKYIYTFTDISKLISACKAIKATGFNGISLIYHDNENNKYYLLIDTPFDNMGEFGGSLCRKDTDLYICEHCVRLKKGNVEILSKL